MKDLQNFKKLPLEKQEAIAKSIENDPEYKKWLKKQSSKQKG